MQLNELSNNPGATKNRKRVGRGPGSGTGKTCGAGQKGQKARTGVAINGFEGGQNSIFIRLPKRGFNNIFRTSYTVVNTGQLQALVDEKRLDSSKPVTKTVLVELGLARKKSLVKLLASGDLNVALDVQLDKASQSAVKAVESAKGKFAAA